MSRKELHELGDLQKEVMEALWSLSEGTVHELREALAGRDLAYTTVLSVLQKLAKQGWVEHRREGRTYVWRPAESRSAEATSSLGALVDRLFGGDPLVAFQHLLDDERVGRDELARLRAMVEAKRKERRGE